MDFWVNSIRLDSRCCSRDEARTKVVPNLKLPSDSVDGEDTKPQRTVTFAEAVASLPNCSSSVRSISAGKKFKPMLDYKAFVRRVDTDWKEPTEELPKIPHGPVELSAPEDKKCVEQDDDSSDNTFELLQFPSVDGGEIDKHKLLNSVAKKTVRHASPCPYEDYLELVRRQIEAQKPKKPKKIQLKEEEKTQTPKLVKKQPRWYWDMSDDSSDKAEPPKPPTPTPKWKVERASRVLLDFKYSYAIEQYYRYQMRRKRRNNRPNHNGMTYENRTEIKLGYLVTTLGANVLNLQARTIPSCNPFELRMRKKLARENVSSDKK